MKKLAALLLALVMTLSLCTVAFAGDVISQISFSVTPYTLNADNRTQINISSLSENCKVGETQGLKPVIVFYDENKTRLYGYSGNNGLWIGNSGPIDAPMDFSNVGYIMEFFTIIPKNSGDDFNQNVQLSCSVNGNSYTLTKMEASAYELGNDYFEESSLPEEFLAAGFYEWVGDRIEIAMAYEYVEPEEDESTNCNLLPIIGAYLAVKAVGNAVKTAVVMPHIVHAVKWVVPTALAALRFGAMSRAMWHLR